MANIIMWALVVAGATLIITCSTLMFPVRQAAKKHVPKLGELLSCPMCCAFWIGVVASLLGYTPIKGFHPALVAFGSGCAAASVGWLHFVVLCRLGHGRLLSTRRDIPDEVKAWEGVSGRGPAKQHGAAA